MRFRAKLAPDHVSLLHSLIVPMSRLSGTGDASSNSCWTRNGSILYLDKDHVRISSKGKTQDTDGIACFAELAATGFNSIFMDHRIESNAENHAILMELDLAQLRLALKSILGDSKSGANGKSPEMTVLAAAALEQQFTILKLAKRQNIPCLCIDACSSGTFGALIQVHHAIPIRILRHTEMQNHLPPQIPLPDVQLELSPNTPLKTVMDRLKAMSCPTVYLEANMVGELTISIHNDGASIQTFFSKLTPRTKNCKTAADSQASVMVKVDARKLCASLHWQQYEAQLVSSAVLCLVENEMVVLHINLKPGDVGFFTYYVPVHFLSSDPADDN